MNSFMIYGIHLLYSYYCPSYIMNSLCTVVKTLQNCQENVLSPTESIISKKRYKSRYQITSFRLTKGDAYDVSSTPYKIYVTNERLSKNGFQHKIIMIQKINLPSPFNRFTSQFITCIQ